MFVSQLLGLFWEPLAYLRSRTSLAEVGDQLLVLTCSLIPGQLSHIQLLLHAPSTLHVSVLLCSLSHHGLKPRDTLSHTKLSSLTLWIRFAQQL